MDRNDRNADYQETAQVLKRIVASIVDGFAWKNIERNEKHLNTI